MSVKIGLSRGRHVRADAFVNNLTGLGVSGRDKRLGAAIAPPDRFSAGALEDLYAADGMFAKIVDMLPEDMIREWIEYEQADDEEGEVESLVMQWLRDLHAQENLEWAMKMARLHGGSVVLLGVNDGREYDEPLDMDNVQSLNYMNVLDRWQIYPTTHVYRDPTRPNYGKPELYRLAPARHSEATGKIVHESRLLRFDGIRMPDRYSLKQWGWGDPIAGRLWNALRSYHQAHDSSVAIIQDFTQAVYKLKGLASMMMGVDESGEGMAALKARMQAVELGRSLLNALVLDEDEEFQKLTTNVAGIEKLLEAVERRLTAESDYPHTRLLGEAPGASLGESGGSQIRDYYDKVAAKQEAQLRRPIERLLDIGLRAKKGPTGGDMPKDFSFGFRPLWQQDEKEMASNRWLQAQADDKYIANGSLTPDEVAHSRFGGSGFSFDTTLDKDARDAMATDPPQDPAPEV